MADCRKCKFGEVDFEGNIVCTEGDDRIEICFAVVEDACEVFVDKEIKEEEPKLSCCAPAPRCIGNDIHSWFITVEVLSGDSVRKLVVKVCPFCGSKLPTPCLGSEVEDYQNLEDVIIEGSPW